MTSVVNSPSNQSATTASSAHSPTLAAPPLSPERAPTNTHSGTRTSSPVSPAPAVAGPAGPSGAGSGSSGRDDGDGHGEGSSGRPSHSMCALTAAASTVV